MKKILKCEYNMDTACVELIFDDGTMIAIDTIAVENEVADTIAQKTELDWLIYIKAVYKEAAFIGQAETVTAETLTGKVPDALPSTVKVEYEGDVFVNESVTWALNAEEFNVADGTKVTVTGTLASDNEVTATVTVNHAYLLADYTFDETTTTTVDETEVITYVDDTGKHADATPNGTVTVVDGLVGKAISLPGGSKGAGNVKLPNNLLVEGDKVQNNFTVSFYTARETQGSTAKQDNSFAVTLHGDTTSNYYGFINKNAQYRVEYRKGGNTDVLGANTTPSVSGDWIHVAIVTNGETGEAWLYRDGVEVAYTDAISWKMSDLKAQNNYIAYSMWSDWDYKGIVDEFEVYNGLLTAEEISKMAETVTKPRVDAELDTAVIGYADGDSAESVTQNLTLPTTGATDKAVTITWTSDNAAITKDGTVVRPSKGKGDKTVNLTATVAFGSYSVTKEFTVTVKQSDKYEFGLLTQAITAAQAKYDAAAALNKYSNASMNELKAAIEAANAVVTKDQEVSGIEEIENAEAAIKEAAAKELELATFDELNENALDAWYPLTADANDASGNGKNGTATGVTFDRDNGATFTTGGALKSYISLPTDVVDKKDKLTLSFWALDKGGNDKQNVFGFANQTTMSECKHFYINTSDPDGYFRVMMNERDYRTTDGIAGANAGFEYPKNTWAQITVVLNDNTMEVYKNGVLVGTDTLTMKVSNVGDIKIAYIGSCIYGANGDNDYNGCVKDFRIYGGAFEASQVKEIYNEMTNIQLGYIADDLVKEMNLGEGNTLAVNADSITLPTTNAVYTDAAISWVSENTDVIANDGTVTLPTFGTEEEVTLTATITLNGETKEVTVNAKVAKLATVKFDTNGGSGSYANQSIAYNGTVEEPAKAPNRLDYKFKFWSADGENAYDFAAPVTDVDLTLTAVWERLTYEVTFNTDGGSAVASQTVNSGDKAAKPEKDPTRDGYKFLGWYAADAADTFDFENTVIRKATTITAKWLKLHTVTYDANGGIAIADPVIVEDGSVIDAAPVTSRTGYTFNYWTLNGEKYDFTAPVTGDMTLVADWTINKYTVTFDANGGSKVESATVDYNTAVAAPTAPTKTGYTFAGWLLDKKAYDFTTLVTEDMTLVADWTINEYTVTFDANGGSKVESAAVEYNKTVAVPTEPAKEGYTFAGWLLDGKAYDFTTPITDNITLTAKWDIITYTVTFVDRNTTTTAATDITKGYLVEEKEPVRAGFIFQGWFAKDAKEAFDFTAPVTGDITLTAVWEMDPNAVLYTITFMNEGVEFARDQVVVGGTVDEPTSRPEKDGYIFAGWTLNGEVYDFATPITGDIVLEAAWNVAEVTVTFDTAGGIEVLPITVNYGDAVTAPVTSKAGHTFTGWTLDGKAYDFAAPVTTDITLVATWTINSYTVTFDANGGSAVDSVTVVYNTTVSKPAAPTRTDYIFKGWFVDGKAYDFATPVTADITITAQWKPDTAKEIAALSALLTEVGALDMADYTEESWNPVQKAIVAAGNVITDEEATKAEVNAVIAKLQAAKDGLVTVESVEKAEATTELTATVEEAKVAIGGLKEADYTAESWKAVTDAIAAAEAVLADANATSKDIQAANAPIAAAIEGLTTVAEVEEAAAKTAATEELKEAIAAAEELAAANYTAATWAKVDEAVEAAKAVLANEAAVSTELKAAAEAITAAIDALVTEEEVFNRKEAKEDVTDAIAKAEALKEADYTADSYKAVKDAITAAKALLADDNAKIADFEAAVADIKAAVNALVTVEEAAKAAAGEALTAAIADTEKLVEADYTADSFKVVAGAVEAAKAVLADANATAADLEAAKAAIETAVAGLVTVAEVEKAAAMESLKAVIANAEGLKEADYTAESWKAVADALAAAKAITAEAATADIKTAEANLTTAVSALQKPVVVVPQEVKVSSITITTKAPKIAAGKKVTLETVVGPENAANKALVWTSSNESLATVANGVVTTNKKAGGKTVTITATAADGSGATASVKVKIMKHAVKKITLKAAKTVKPGKTTKVKATIKTTGKKVNKTLVWTSSNEAWATVNSKGVVKAAKTAKGKTVTITATSTDGTNKKAKVKIKIK